jgi:hypothetical protein
MKPLQSVEGMEYWHKGKRGTVRQEMVKEMYESNVLEHRGFAEEFEGKIKMMWSHKFSHHRHNATQIAVPTLASTVAKRNNEELQREMMAEMHETEMMLQQRGLTMEDPETKIKMLRLDYYNPGQRFTTPKQTHVYTTKPTKQTLFGSEFTAIPMTTPKPTGDVVRKEIVPFITLYPDPNALE